MLQRPSGRIYVSTSNISLSYFNNCYFLVFVSNILTIIISVCSKKKSLGKVKVRDLNLLYNNQKKGDNKTCFAFQLYRMVNIMLALDTTFRVIHGYDFLLLTFITKHSKVNKSMFGVISCFSSSFLRKLSALP